MQICLFTLFEPVKKRLIRLLKGAQQNWTGADVKFWAQGLKRDHQAEKTEAGKKLEAEAAQKKSKVVGEDE